MPALTRRRDPDARQERWRVFFGDVQVGTTGMRSGVPVGVDQWDWSCGFYPASDRGQFERGIAADFFKSHTAFERAWLRLLPTLIPLRRLRQGCASCIIRDGLAAFGAAAVL